MTAAVHAAGDRRPLRPVLEGVHPGHGRRRVRRTGPRAAAARGSPSASSTTSPGTSLRLRPVAGHRAARHGARGLLRPRLGRHGRREQEHDQDPRRRGAACTPRATSSTTRRSRARRPCRTCASGRQPIRAPYLVRQAELRRLPPVRVARPGRRARPGGARRDVAAQLPAPAGRGLGRAAAARCRSRSSPRASTSTPSTPTGSPARPAWPGASTPSCRPASSPSPACCRASEAIAAIKEAIEKTYGRRGAEVVERNQAAVDQALDGAAPRSRCPSRVTATREPPPPVPAHAPEFVRTVTAEMMAGRGDDLPVSALPVDGTYPERHDRVREAQHLRAGRGLGSRPLHPVRQLQLRLPAQRDPLQVLRHVRSWTGAPDGFQSAPLEAVGLPDTPLHAAGLRRGLHRLRAVRRGLPGRRRPATRSARRSTSAPRRAAGGRRAREHRVLRDAAGQRPVPGGLRHGARHPVPASRCSSSPAPAPAAARRRTSSCSRSCSATG